MMPVNPLLGNQEIFSSTRPLLQDAEGGCIEVRWPRRLAAGTRDRGPPNPAAPPGRRLPRRGALGIREAFRLRPYE